MFFYIFFGNWIKNANNAERTEDEYLFEKNDNEPGKIQAGTNITFKVTLSLQHNR